MAGSIPGLSALVAQADDLAPFPGGGEEPEPERVGVHVGVVAGGSRFRGVVTGRHPRVGPRRAKDKAPAARAPPAPHPLHRFVAGSGFGREGSVHALPPVSRGTIGRSHHTSRPQRVRHGNITKLHRMTNRAGGASAARIMAPTAHAAARTRSTRAEPARESPPDALGTTRAEPDWAVRADDPSWSTRPVLTPSRSVERP